MATRRCLLQQKLSLEKNGVEALKKRTDPLE